MFQNIPLLGHIRTSLGVRQAHCWLFLLRSDNGLAALECQEHPVANNYEFSALQKNKGLMANNQNSYYLFYCFAQFFKRHCFKSV